MRFEKQMWNGDSIFLQEVTLLITVCCRNAYTRSILFKGREWGKEVAIAPHYTNVDISISFLF